MLETEASAASRDAPVLGEVLGGGYACEAQGLLAIRDDGDGVGARDRARRSTTPASRAADVGMIVAHGNGTPPVRRLEAAAIRGRLRREAAAGDRVQVGDRASDRRGRHRRDDGRARRARRRAIVPGIATLRELDPECAGIPMSIAAQEPRSNVALVLCRGFAGTDAALLVRAA